MDFVAQVICVDKVSGMFPKYFNFLLTAFMDHTVHRFLTHMCRRLNVLIIDHSFLCSNQRQLCSPALLTVWT